MKDHIYEPEILWTGNRGGGTARYDGYDRAHEISVPSMPKAARVFGTADPKFLGAADGWNPEELFVSSLSSCHMLWYLHLCADAGVVVTGYRDEPKGKMELSGDGGGRFVSIELRPHVLISAASDAQLARSLHEDAHRYCFIASSVSCPVLVKPTISRQFEPGVEELTPWGRSAAEYRLMFNLTEADNRVRILGCGDGPASFNAEVRKAGGKPVSVDPLFRYSAEEITERIQTVAPIMRAHLEEHERDYRWSIWGSPTSAVEARFQAMDRFLADYEAGKREGRYIAASLPYLPFGSRRFDLALVSHLLFLESESLSLDFHLASLVELSRVASEVRVYPLIEASGRVSRHLEQVVDRLQKLGHTVTEVPTEYEFRKGANRYLSVTRASPTSS